jgi:hypothetical protein
MLLKKQKQKQKQKTKPNSIEDSVGNEENGYPVPDPQPNNDKYH